MKLLVVDIETTGFLQSDVILEIGISLVDTKNKTCDLIFDKVIKDEHFNPTLHSQSWIFKNSTLRVEDVINANSLASYFSEIQDYFDKYLMTAYNKAFDLRFLRKAGFTINDVDCLMKRATKYSNYIDTKGRIKKPSVEEIYNQFFSTSNEVYIEKHRAGCDVIDESRILLHMVDLKLENNDSKKIIVESKPKAKGKVIDIMDTLTFGKHNGSVFSDVIKKDPNYIKWCVKTIPTFKISPQAEKLLTAV